jgi:hypothetical protein
MLYHRTCTAELVAPFFEREKKLKRKEAAWCGGIPSVSKVSDRSTMMQGPAGTCGSTWRLRPGAASLVAHVLLNSFASPLLQLAKVRPWSVMDGTVVASLHAHMHTCRLTALHAHMCTVTGLCVVTVVGTTHPLEYALSQRDVAASATTNKSLVMS